MVEIAEKTKLNQSIELAFRLGLERDQLERFIAAGYIPQARQMEFHAQARLADESGGPNRIGYDGTRGQAKSHAIWMQSVADDMQRRQGLKGLYLRKIQKRAQESFDDLRRKTLRFVKHTYLQGVLKLPNSSFMILGGFHAESDIDGYLGIEYDFVIIEDAMTLSHSKYEAIGGSIRTSRDDWRPRMYLSANPGGIGHAWYVKEIRNGKPGAAFVHTQMGDNVFINQEYEDYLNGLTGFLRRAWRDGDFSISAGQFFTTFSDKHIIAPFPIPADWEIIGSLDYGMSHPTAIHLLAQSNDGQLYVIGEHVAARTPVEVHVKAVHYLLAQQNISLPRLRAFVAGGDVFAESRTDGGTIARDYLEYGIKLTMANTARIQGAQEIQKRLGNPEMGIEPTLFIFNTCPRLIETLPMMQHDPKRLDDVLKVDADINGENGDDEYDSARYGIMYFAKGRKPEAAGEIVEAELDIYKTKYRPENYDGIKTDLVKSARSGRLNDRRSGRKAS